MKREIDRYSFILGMITAFCECVAGGCKRLALSPPLGQDDYSMKPCSNTVRCGKKASAPWIRSPLFPNC